MSCRIGFAERHLWKSAGYGRPHSGLMLAAPITLPTLFYFAGDALAKAGGRADQRRAAHVGKPRRYLGIRDGGVDLFV
jgi:hypothetical protein